MDKKLKYFVWHYQQANASRKYLQSQLKLDQMIIEVCNDLKNALMSGVPLDLADTFAGLAQVVTYKTTDENGNSLTKKMPVSYDTNIGDGCTTKSPEKALVPNSAKKGIIYFEDNGGVQVLRRLSGGRVQHRATIILVCWTNRKNSIGKTYGKVTKAAYDEIRDKLAGVLPSEYFINLKATPTRFRQDTQVFGKYTYDETVLQYLRPPFEYFALDLNVTFISTCKTPVTINPASCETLDNNTQ